MKATFLLIALLSLCLIGMGQAQEIKQETRIETSLKENVEYRLLSVQMLNYSNIYVVENQQGAIIVTNAQFPKGSMESEIFILKEKKLERAGRASTPADIAKWRKKPAGTIGAASIPALKNDGFVTSLQ